MSCGHGDGFIYGVVNDDRHELYGVFECYRCVLNVLGPCFAELGNNFSPLSDTGTWLMSFAMILGRREYFTVLVLFYSVFWRY
ncbi:hypothetical protein [Marinomonas primoryensis]|uniref:hypothetical protein n=1 Tax=Marinomonas primoryensis TaxID=178399 RepID=UPI0037039129